LSQNLQRAAFEKLFESYYTRLHYFAKQYVYNNDDAEELVNDSFIAIWGKREELIFDQSLKPYLYTTVKNRCINFIKKNKIETIEIEKASYELVAEDTFDVLQQLNKKETENLIFAAIAKLPPKCKQVFLLSRKEELSYKEIAAILDINIKTVENQIGIALKFIRKKLSIENNGTNPKNLHLPTILFFLYETCDLYF